MYFVSGIPKCIQLQDDDLLALHEKDETRESMDQDFEIVDLQPNHDATLFGCMGTRSLAIWSSKVK
jgi:hypothetical protein